MWPHGNDVDGHKLAVAVKHVALADIEQCQILLCVIPAPGIVIDVVTDRLETEITQPAAYLCPSGVARGIPRLGGDDGELPIKL